MNLSKIPGSQNNSIKQRYWPIALRTSKGFFDLGNVITSGLLQVLGILSGRKQEERKPHNQEFRAAPACSISSGKIELGPQAFSVKEKQ